MEEEIELGSFWLPANPEEKLDGRITIDDQQGTILTTYGEFDPHKPESKQEIIHGEISGKRITLTDCAITHQSMTSHPKGDETTWHCRFAFHGGEHYGIEPNRIKSIEVVIESLYEWASGFEPIQMDKYRSSLFWNENHQEQTARWNLGEIALCQDIGIGWSGTSKPGIQRATVNTRNSFQARFDKPQDLGTALATATNLQGLISIAKGEAVHIEETEIFQDGTPEWITVSYPRILHRGATQTRHSELLTMEELGGAEGIAQWLNILQGQEALIISLLVDRYRQPAFVTDRTSHLLIACEAYHRHRMADSNKEIWKYGKNVLDPMISKAGPPFKDWIGNREDWIKSVLDIRNKHGVAHLQSYGNSPTEQPKYRLTNDQLYLLTILCLLSECNVSEETRREVIKRMKSDFIIHLPNDTQTDHSPPEQQGADS